MFQHLKVFPGSGRDYFPDKSSSVSGSLTFSRFSRTIVNSQRFYVLFLDLAGSENCQEDAKSASEEKLE